MAIEIKLDKPIEFRFTENGEQVGAPYNIAGITLFNTLNGTYNKSIYKDPLKDIYVALSRAIEEGDNLKLGIVIGQTITKLESIIND